MKSSRHFMQRLNYLIFWYYQKLCPSADRECSSKLLAYAKESVKSLLALRNLHITKAVCSSIVAFFLVLFLQGGVHASFSPMETQMIRIQIIEKGISHEWEFDHPDQYEYEIGEKIIKGEHGKQLVEEIIHLLKLQETSQVDVMVGIMKERYPDLEHLDIRLRNDEGKLYTWVWNKKNTSFNQVWQRSDVFL